MLAMNLPDTVSFSDTALLRMLSSRNHRPNLLIENRHASFEGVLQQLASVCESPLWATRFPGVLDLHNGLSGTLVLGDIERMTLSQQVVLSDWLARKGSDVQVVSVTRAPMPELIADGRFLEGLYFRLNTVMIRATALDSYCSAW